MRHATKQTFSGHPITRQQRYVLSPEDKKFGHTTLRAVLAVFVVNA
jgi:hypothetical protein